LRALLAFVVVLVLGVAAFALLAPPQADAKMFGEGIGRLSVFCAAAAFLASWLRQTGRRTMAIAVIAVFGTLLGALFVFLVVASRHRGAGTPALTAAERVPLLIVDENGERRLKHPAFGFSLLHPGPGFQESADVVKAMGMQADGATQVYGFMEERSRSAVVVSVMKGMGGSKFALANHIDGVLRGVQHALAGNGQLRILRKDTVWEERAHVGRLSVAVGDGMRLDLAAYAVERAAQPPFIVDIIVASPEPQRFAAMLSSFRS